MIVCYSTKVTLLKYNYLLSFYNSLQVDQEAPEIGTILQVTTTE